MCERETTIRIACLVKEAFKDRNTLRGKRGGKLNELHNNISQGGRSSFDLDLSVHSLHAERLKGRVSLWLASAG